MVTVAFACSSRCAIGLPTIARAADDDGARALGLDVVLVEHAHDPERRAGHEPGRPR